MHLPIYKVGDRVITPFGAGTVEVLETFNADGDTKPYVEGDYVSRYGIKHDVFPPSREIDQFPDELFYMCAHELYQEKL